LLSIITEKNSYNWIRDKLRIECRSINYKLERILFWFKYQKYRKRAVIS